MTSAELKLRTHRFAIRLVRLTEHLRRGRAADHTARQLLRAGTSVAANYRAACRARSRNEFVAKLGIVEEEGDETAFWLEIMAGAGLVGYEQIRELLREARELTAIVVTSIRTARARGANRATRR